MQGLSAVILGGTSGVGLAAAQRFAAEGARGLVLMGRNAERGTAACEAVEGDVSFVAVDGEDPAAVSVAAAEAESRLGGVDVLVNTTGPSKMPRLLHDFEISELQDAIDSLILPPVHMTHALLPGMRARGSGSVITIASDAAKVPTPGESLVGAGMAALVMFCKTAAVEAKREGVRINVLTPSLIAGTPGSERIYAEEFTTKIFAKAEKAAHLGVPEADDLVEALLFLAGPGSARMTGQVISINGGISVA